MTDGLYKLEAGIWISGLMKSGRLANLKVRMLFNTLGNWENLYDAKPETIMEILDESGEIPIPAEQFLKSEDERSKAASESKRCDSLYGKGSFKCFFINEEVYPFKLKELTSAPAVIYCCSDTDTGIMNSAFCAAVVGTRTPSHYGRKITEKIISGLEGTRSIIISGMARGIDTIAHISAIRSGLPTAAILGCGADISYPPENFEMMKNIIREGMILSECLPGTRPVRSYFPARNRLISGSSDCVIVTEASEDSGTMITTNFAGDQGRDVFAVPGSVFSPLSSGTNKLIQDGAYVITSARDIIENYRFDILNSGHRKAVLNEQVNQTDNYPVKLKTIVDLIRNDQMTFEELAGKSGLTISKLTELLTEGEISGHIGFEKGRYFLT